jgi:hypothetical protein
VLQQFRIEQRENFFGARIAGVQLAKLHASILFDTRMERIALAEGRDYVPEDIPEDERPAAVDYDIFGEWVLEEDDEIEEPPPPPEPNSVLPWEELGAEEQALEVAIAVNDPRINIAAVAEGVLVPMPAMSKPMMGDQHEVWTHFEAWYSEEFNNYREDILHTELDIAAKDADVAREWALAKVEVPTDQLVDEEGEPLEEKTLFTSWYFNTKGSRDSRIGFLEMKVADLVRQYRETALQLRNKIPTPVMSMSLPALAVDKPEVPVYRIKVYSWHLDAYTIEEMSEWYEDEQLGLEDYTFAEAEKAEMERKALERKKAEEDAREKVRLEQDKKQLEIEDREAALARLLAKDMDDDADAIMELDGNPQGYVFESPFDPEFIDGKSLRTHSMYLFPLTVSSLLQVLATSLATDSSMGMSRWRRRSGRRRTRGGGKSGSAEKPRSGRKRRSASSRSSGGKRRSWRQSSAIRIRKGR